jgi:hypothetical protein
MIVNRSDLSVEEREEYVSAVKCLMKLPSKADKFRFSGAVSRFDDFVAYHMIHAMQLHDNYHLFGAHKYFVWLYEQALRNECGYKGYQPVGCLENGARLPCVIIDYTTVRKLRPLRGRSYPLATMEWQCV